MTDCTSFSVDTLDDLKRVEAAMKNDPLMNTYIA